MAVVAYFEAHRPVSALGVNLDDSSCFALGDAVPDGVFNQRLKKELRRQRVERRRINLHPDSQTVLKTDLFNLQIPFEYFQLLPELNFVRHIPGQSDAQQGAEL